MKIVFESDKGSGSLQNVLVIPVDSTKVSPVGALPKALKAIAETACKRAHFKAKHLEILDVPLFNQGEVTGLVLVGFDPRGANESAGSWSKRVRVLGGVVARAAERLRSVEVSLVANDLGLDKPAAQAFVEGALLSGYSFTRYKSKTEASAAPKKKSRTLFVRGIRRGLDGAIGQGTAVANGVIRARDLINTPPSDMRPGDFVVAAREVARKSRLKIDVYDVRALRRMGAQGILTVGQGSDAPPFLVRLQYRPAKPSKKRIALVGKGVTFDSGGYCIKPATGMENMKYDMAGAAAVLGAMQVLSELKPKAEVSAYIPLAENMINGQAMRTGDVIRALNGKTMEVLNTDAEGRLILADALSLAVKEGATTIVDLATLTGACMVALGDEYAGLFASDDALAAALLESSSLAGESLWRMPLAPEYRELIKSPVADIKNTGGRHGGAITAALFLQEFVGKVPWAHLDIAGPAFTEKDRPFTKRGGVGFGVRTIVQYVVGQ